MDRVANKAVKERPILFRAEMVRAILDGRKTQTRRFGKIQSVSFTGLGVEYSNHATKGVEAVATYLAYPGRGTARWGICSCPYGVPGDRLWVRESHYRWGRWVKNGRTKSGKQAWRFDTDGAVRFAVAESRSFTPAASREREGWHLRPSIFMPRWASRITLEITSVRVERVQEISEEDAQAEGINSPSDHYARQFPSYYRDGFQILWDTMRAGSEFAWSENPWVWVISFRRIS